ncbi:inositol monophosphatase family protein [Amycolatopsis umgeniensis]|uniref:inositol-phosphate phosphatase n=1 Tax=Amycolatopsis umgeniensis TaxID=336628 RepID=A0A841ATU9_9PSEU|nr:inositol monophosphatase [Amycolatopsis umgeniensis]MBB5849920.1 myo-inositol-1(or 4)-monophosphatase [Amycolatopsis umgeniensis]
MIAPDPGFAEFIETGLREASKVAVDLRGTGEVTVKPSDVNQIVTGTDLAIGALLTGRIRERYPRHAILEEESGGTSGADDVTWIVDPLDGTSNYAAGSPLYGVMMAAVGSDGVLAGGLALPAFDLVYVAESGKGATRNGQPLGSLPATGADRSLVAFGMDKGPPELMAVDSRLAAALGTACLGVRMSNSVFDICMVADGAYGAFVHRSCRIWDVAAALCVLRECGAVCTDLGGRPLDLTDPLTKADQVFEVCLASASVHPAVMAALRTVVPG